jgi:hypothetical protein
MCRRVLWRCVLLRCLLHLEFVILLTRITMMLPAAAALSVMTASSHFAPRAQVLRGAKRYVRGLALARGARLRRFLQRAGTNREPAGWLHRQRSRPGWPGGGDGEPLASGAERTAQTTG